MSNKITVEKYAASGAILNRRGQPVSASYLYRLIREHIQGKRAELSFKYILTGAKDRIWIDLT